MAQSCVVVLTNLQMAVFQNFVDCDISCCNPDASIWFKYISGKQGTPQSTYPENFVTASLLGTDNAEDKAKAV